MRRAGTILVVFFLALGFAAPAQAAAAYPSPPHDFSHPGTTHGGRPLFSHTGGQADRALLVIYIRWDDVDYPSDFDAATVALRYFGTGFPSTTFPSVGDYFRRLSFNDLFVFPASESEGTAQDGVVQVHYPGTKADFFATSITQRNRTLLQLADPYFDYSTYDVDGNGRLDNQEIIVNMLEAEPNLPLGGGCGIARNVDPVTLDGINLDALFVPMANTATNLITIIHENGHALFDMPDLYGFGVGSLDLAGPTCGYSDTALFAPNAWTKMHLGWITPTVVEADGFYEVRRADTTGDSFILYDPDFGTNDYFMVENRERTPLTYDRGASDSGLVIWRVNDDSLGVATGLRPIEPMMPDGSTTTTNNYGGSMQDAWDPTDPATPQRTMAREWADGTASRVAVRAIGPKGETIRAYFDVPGPGILVDTYPVDQAGPLLAIPGITLSLDVPIMNTAESGCDTFLFEPVNLPSDWTMTGETRSLCAGETSSTQLTITPGTGAATGIHDIAIRGSSQTNPAVVTTSPLKVEVRSAAQLIQDVADAITAMLPGATPGVRSSLLSARDELIGNNAGAAGNGALDALLAGDPVGALTKLSRATSDLLTAQSLGASVDTQLRLVGLIGESIARTQLAAAQAASPGSTKTLAKIADLIATGHEHLEAAQYAEALGSFKQAVAKAAGLLP